MPYKDGGGGKPQPYDDETGKQTKFKHFAKPREHRLKIIL